MKIVKRFAPLLLAVVLVFGSCLSVSAAEITTTDNMQVVFIDYDTSVYPYWIVYKNGSSYTIKCTSKPLVYDNGKIRATGAIKQLYGNRNISGNIITITSFTSGSLTELNYMNYAENISAVVASNYDVINIADNTTFFLPPPPNLVKAVEVLPEVITPQVKIVTTIAVSCLALLISLVMLRKKLPIFLRS